MQTTNRSQRDGRAESHLGRVEAISSLITDHREFLIVTGLAGAAKDVTAITEGHDNVYALAGAMGGAVSVGLGLALARPGRRVLTVTGDGELLMNVGSLATVAVTDPRNYAIICVDNGRYGETGNQESHTGRGVNLEVMARGSGFANTCTVEYESDLTKGRDLLHETPGPSFLLLRVGDGSSPSPRRNLDAAVARVRFRDALRATVGELR